MACALLVGAVATIGAVVVLSQGGENGPTDAELKRSKRLAATAIELATKDPARAAQLARDSYRAAPSADAERALATVVVANRQLVVVRSAHSRVTALAASAKGVFSSGTDGRLRSWDPHGGKLLAEARVPADTHHLAATDNASILASSGPDGDNLRLWNARQRGDDRLTSKRLVFAPGPRAALAMLAFSPDGGQLLLLDREGRLTRWDATSGDRLGVELLTDRDDMLGDRLREAGPRPIVAAAPAELPGYVGPFRVVVAIRGGWVIDFAKSRPGMSDERPTQLVASGDLTGTIRSVAVGGDDDVAIGTTAGAAIVESVYEPPREIATPPSEGVAFSRHFLLSASGHGVGVADLDAIDPFDDDDQTLAAPPRGRPATLVAASGELAAAAHSDGSLTILDRHELGSTLPSADASNGVAFDGDRVILTDGSERDVEGLIALDPWRAELVGDSYFERRTARSYRPARDWWGADERFYVNDVVVGDGLVVAGGQAPDGTAVVLVWDADTGEPRARLPLTDSGIESTDVKVVSQVAVLPRKNLIVAHSAAQETVVSWSTDDWRQLATTDVDAIGDLSVAPDEERIAVARLSDEDAGTDAGHERGAVVILDTDELRVVGETDVDGALRLAYAPDGETLAVVSDDGELSLRSPDGRHRVTRPVLLDEYLSVYGVDWRPDGRQLAVAIGYDGVALLDPRADVPPARLPPAGDGEAREVTFSPDGRLLAVTSVESDDDGGISGLDTSFWHADPAGWANRRMCELGARCEADASALDVSGLPLGELDAGEASGALDEAVTAYAQQDRLLVADADGRSTAIGPIRPDAYQARVARWSEDGEVLAWMREGELFAERAGDDRQWRWPCRCWGFAVDGDEIVAMAIDGGALLRFDLDSAWPRRTVLKPALPADRTELLTVVDGKAIVAVGPYPMGYQGGPIEFRTVTPSGSHERLARESSRLVYGTARTNAAGDEVAYAVGNEDYVSCGEDERIAVLDVAAARVSYPDLPNDREGPVDVRGIGFGGDGDLTVTLAEPGCDATDTTLPVHPPGAAHVWRDGRFDPLDVDGPLFDFVAGRRGDVLLLGKVKNSSESPTAATLWIRVPDEKPVRVAGGVTSAQPRP